MPYELINDEYLLLVKEAEDLKKKLANTHFTIETRSIIENLLNEGKNITQIANELQRDRSNIGREIKKHRQIVLSFSSSIVSPCLKYSTCPIKNFECYKTCKNLVINLCEKLISSPHVCNGCDTKKNCRHVKYYYKAIEANNEYRNSWSDDRIGLQYSELELNILNNDFKNLVLNNRSIYHSLIVINKRGFNFKQFTIYKQIEKDQLELKSSNLSRCRKSRKTEEKNRSYKNKNIDGHTYEDYENHKEKNPKDNEIQLDTVEGIKENNAPVLLTIEIVEINFLFMFKINTQTAEEVKFKLKYLITVLGEELTKKLFKIVLTDNGKEFPLSVLAETLLNSNIFYCHPYSSYEKGSIENNHELIRRVIPKGVSIKPYSQKELDLLCSHINSLYRESLDSKCPLDLIYNYIPKEILDKLNIKKIDDDKVLLNPYLLGDKNIQNIKKYLDDKEIKEAHISL